MCLFYPVNNGNQETFNQLLGAQVLAGLAAWLLGRLLGEVPESRDLQAPGLMDTQLSSIITASKCFRTSLILSLSMPRCIKE